MSNLAARSGVRPRNTLLLLVFAILGSSVLNGPAYAEQGGLSLVHANAYPTRLAQGQAGEIYVTDARADALFIHGAGLDLVGEIKGLDRPLGVAVGPAGRIYVGHDGIDRVTAYDPDGAKIPGLGSIEVKMPNDLAVDRAGRVYMVDSLNAQVLIFDADGCAAGHISVSGFPVCLALAYGGPGEEETGTLYVGEQRFGRIHVYDLQGNNLRIIGGKVRRNWQGKFVRIQSLAVDGYGRLHVLDSFMNRVQILDAVTGEYIDSYGEFGPAPGQLSLPLDILIRGDEVIAANAENGRLEVIYRIP